MHPGAAETSEMLFLRPDLAPTSLGEAESPVATHWPTLVRIARESSWPSYVGSPRVATAAQAPASIGRPRTQRWPTR